MRKFVVLVIIFVVLVTIGVLVDKAFTYHNEKYIETLEELEQRY